MSLNELLMQYFELIAAGSSDSLMIQLVQYSIAAIQSSVHSYDLTF